MDHNLKFDLHCIKLKNALSKRLGLFHRLKCFLPSSTLKIIYDSLVKSILAYGIEIWYSAPAYILNKIFICQKKIIRAICNLGYFDHTNNSFKSLCILKLEDLYKVNLSTVFFDAIILNKNANVLPNLRTRNDFHNYPLRNSSHLILPFFHYSRTQRGFLYRGISIWNSLPSNIKNCKSGKCFKARLAFYYLSTY